MSKQERVQVQATRREEQAEAQRTPAEEAAREERIESIVQRLGTTNRGAELIHSVIYDDLGA